MTKRLTRTAAFVAAATPSFSFAPIPAASAQDAPSSGTAVARLSGQDRYATSLAVAEAVADDAGGKLDTAVLVSGRSWTDTVTAAPLAGSLGAPVLLADPRNGISSDIKEFLERVGVNRIIVIGSTKRVPEAALSGLSGIDDSIERITATNKYALSAAVASEMGTLGSLGGFGRTVIVASGDVFADAVAGATDCHETGGCER